MRLTHTSHPPHLRVFTHFYPPSPSLYIHYLLSTLINPLSFIHPHVSLSFIYVLLPIKHTGHTATPIISGITSYQCMEATPSLACANKCVFCWRHHKNPVGTDWRWKTDDPLNIVEEVITYPVNTCY